MMPQPLTRRAFLSAASFAGAAVALSACGGDSSNNGSSTDQAGGSDGGGKLAWWDQFLPLEDLHKSVFDQFTADGGAAVEYTVYNPNEQGEALQLAYGSEQLPDVFTLAGVNVPPPVLVDQGWFSPVANADVIQGSLPEGTLAPGLHLFGDELYSFPIFTFRQYEALNWFNRTLVEGAGLDPDNPPTSWDDFRAAAKAVQQSGSAGILLPIAFPQRMQTTVLELAQTAGFPGIRPGNLEGIDLTTGAYAFHHDAIIQAVEFLLSFQQDKTLFPASNSLDARQGRARWAGGAAGYFFDGPWNPGVISGEFTDFLEQLGVGPIPTPDGSTPVLTRPPTGGTFWVSGQSSNVEQASALLELFVAEDYQIGLAAAMDQPPLDLAVVADSDAHETYKQAVNMYSEQVFLGPSPQVRNPKVAEVQAAMTPVEPGLGAIVQGAFTGQIDDLKGALQKLSDASEKEREAAIQEVGSGDVSVDDWVFSDWRPGVDYNGDA